MISLKKKGGSKMSSFVTDELNDNLDVDAIKKWAEEMEEVAKERKREKEGEERKKKKSSK
jgi:hypothetical protein